jgi:hypothetical protein
MGNMTADQLATPTISRVLPDGGLIELVYDPVADTTALAVADAAGNISVESGVELPTGERLAPYSARNNLIANGCVLLPSAVGEFSGKDELIASVRAFLHRHVDLKPIFEEIAAHYVLLTWVYDVFSDLPYLRFRGDFGTGKTRALLTVGSLCYKPFFASGASTVSPIFHIQDAFQGTLILDEADFRFSDQTSELTKVLNNGTTRGMPVLRTMTNRHRELNPTAFRVFGPKIIAMRRRYEDDALESRFLTEETGGRPVRADVPIHLPASFKDEAQELRNRLLAWRLCGRAGVTPEPSRVPATLSPRTKQSCLALFSLIDDADLRARVAAELAGEEARGLTERAHTLDGAMLRAVQDAYLAGPAPNAPIAGITERFNQQALALVGAPVSNRWVGGYVRRRFGLATLKSGGVYVIPPSERQKVTALATRFGVNVES